ncbi:MAG: hypothetical protein A4E64_01178 [Syntrophorhabdus sp. PtaU1.Bin058]|nr:MAG: hypothetical protein A4E64_01178 [Syntrophorhabdus sp. PtaU1.Bin058]
MYIWPDCFPCITKMFMEVARNSLDDEQTIQTFTGMIEKHRPKTPRDFKVTSPEIIRDLWVVFHEMSGIADPLKKMKKKQNDTALSLHPSVKKSVLESNDPLASAIKFSISGNAIDIMTIRTEQPVEEIIQTLQSFSLDAASTEQFRERLSRAKKIVFFGDNCGEIVFDKILIEIIQGHFGSDVTFVTRTLPVLNDATLEDALYAGMDAVTHTVENGIRQPLPGTIIEKLPEELRELTCESDLVISKGGGNYDTLTEEAGLKGKISFLLQAKCRPYVTLYRVPLGSPIIANI